MNRFVILNALLLLSVLLNAQYSIGFNFGLNRSQIHSNTLDFNGGYGFCLGTVNDYKVDDLFTARAELNITSKRSSTFQSIKINIDDDGNPIYEDYKVKYDLTHIELPIAVVVKPIKYYYAFAGGGFNFLLNRKTSYEDHHIRNYEDIKIVKLDYGFQAGVGFERNKYGVFIRYYRGLRNIFEDFSGKNYLNIIELNFYNMLL